MPNRGVISTDPEMIQSIVNPEDRVIFNNHQFPSCSHLVISINQEYCYVVFGKRKTKNIINFTEIFYISNLQVFKQTLNSILFFFLKDNNSLFTKVDTRLLKGQNMGSGITHSLIIPRLYRSSELHPEQIDNLYSELIIFY